MTELKNTPVTTLKAEVVNDVVIEKKGTSYPSDFECEIAVKVGNKVEDLTYVFGRDYQTSDRTQCIHMTRGSKVKFEALEQAGIEIDYSDIEKIYAKAIEVCKENIEKDKVKAAKQRKLDRAKFYDNSWVNAFVENVHSDKRFDNYQFEFTFMNRQKYIDSVDKLWVRITYKGIIGSFLYSEYYVSSRSYRSRGEMKYNVCNGMKLHEDGSYESLAITDDKDRKGKLPKSVVHRWLQDVDVYLAIKKSRKNRKEKEEKDRQDYIKVLEEKSEMKVTAKNEYIWRDSKRGGSYYSWKYYIELKPIGDNEPRKLKIDYSDYHKTFSIDGLSGLKEFQFKSIIEIMKKEVK